MNDKPGAIPRVPQADSQVLQIPQSDTQVTPPGSPGRCSQVPQADYQVAPKFPRQIPRFPFNAACEICSYITQGSSGVRSLPATMTYHYVRMAVNRAVVEKTYPLATAQTTQDEEEGGTNTALP